MTKLRAGISGCGKAGLAAVLQIRRHEFCDVVAAHDPSAEALRAFREQTAIGLCTASFDELLATGIDFVILAGPCGVRMDQVQRAAEQGVHCLLHAPMAPDSTAAAAMVAVCEQAQVKLGVAVNGQDDPVLEQLRRMIASDWLGGPVCVQGLWAENPMLSTLPPAGSWQLQPELAGRDPMLVLASHHVHLASWLLGRSVLEVTAQTATGFLPLPADGAVATARLRGNVLCTFAASHLAAARVLAIHGTDGGVRIAGDRVWLLGHTEFRGEVFDYLRPREELVVSRADLQAALAAQAPDAELHGRFARWIDDLDDFPCPGDQAVLDMQVLDAMARAATSGQREVV